MNTLKEIRYDVFPEDIDLSAQTVFLAGPTVRGNQPHLTSWRNEAIDLFKKKGFVGNLIIPEFLDKTESDQFRYDIPQWEFFGLTNAHVIMFWIARTRELIGLTTNHEFGYWTARDREKIVYGRPKDAYRVTYCDIMWVEDAKRRQRNNRSNGEESLIQVPCPIYTTLEKTVDATLKHFFPWNVLNPNNYE
jgi:hypothetical protein